MARMLSRRFPSWKAHRGWDWPRQHGTQLSHVLAVDQATQLVQSPIWNQAIAAVLARPAPGAMKGAPAGSASGTPTS